MRSKLLKFRECIDKELYYEAHEVLEEIWFPKRFEDDAEVKLLKGFINSAVCFELIKRGRIEQSKKVWGNYLKYRQLIYKIDTQNKNELYNLSRYIEDRYKKFTTFS